jgi:ribose/xylose/arabinose/galactoside ABC-type transport system permease subunit
VKVSVYAITGLVSAIAGIVHAGQFNFGSANDGTGYELTAIAAVVIGGTSLMGGRGTVVGAALGALLMESLSNGMSLMNLPSAYQPITVGLVLLFAVYADMRSRGRAG